MHWIYITADVDKAREAEASGVDEIMIDLEWMGKAERQSAINAHSSTHGIDDIAPIAAAVATADVLVRVNPLHERSGEETEDVIARGADRLMLPMFQDKRDVARFLELVGEVPVTLLVETSSALQNLPDYIGLLRPQDRVHFGLNDLSLAYGLAFVFEPLALGLLEDPAAVCRKAQVPFGIGGLGRQGLGPLPPDFIIGEHVRLGSSRAILSRAFREPELGQASLEAEIGKLAKIYERFLSSERAALDQNRLELKQLVVAIADANRTVAASKAQ